MPVEGGIRSQYSLIRYEPPSLPSFDSNANAVPLSPEEAAKDILENVLSEVDSEKARLLLETIADIPFPEAKRGAFTVGLRFFWEIFRVPPHVFANSSSASAKRTSFFRDAFGLHFDSPSGETPLVATSVVESIGNLILYRNNR